MYLPLNKMTKELGLKEVRTHYMESPDETALGEIELTAKSVAQLVSQDFQTWNKMICNNSRT